MAYSVLLGGDECKVILRDDNISFTSRSTSVSIPIDDVLGCETVSSGYVFRQTGLDVWYIKEQDDYKLEKSKVQIAGERTTCDKLRTDVQDRLEKLTNRPKRLLALINPIGGNKTGVKDFHSIVSPALSLANIKCDVIVSERHKHMVEVITKYDLDNIDGILIHGGDGSFAEVVNVLLRKAQEKAGIDLNKPEMKLQKTANPIAMIPTGTGNGVCETVTGYKDILNATLHVIKGKVSHINVIGTYADGRLMGYAGIASSYGSLTDMIFYSDRRFRWLGRLRYLGTSVWMYLFKTMFRTFNAEVTFYGNVSEADKKGSHGTREKEVLIEGTHLKRIKSYTKDSVVINGNFVTILPLSRNFIDQNTQKLDFARKRKRYDDVFSVMLYNDNITLRKWLKHLQRMITNTDEPADHSFFDIINVRGIKIRVTDEEVRDGSELDLLTHTVLIDGELMDIKNMEIEYWMHEMVVPVFSSYLIS